MTESILTFTFSPIQGFISEARRAADLYAGSQILIALAQSVAETIGRDNLIYPAEITVDVPNKIVAHVPSNMCRTLAEAAKEKLLYTWIEEIAQPAGEEFLGRFNPPGTNSGWFQGAKQPALLGRYDPEWDAIWQRQISKEYLWEVYWAAAEVNDALGYLDAYQRAEKALAAVKRARPFGGVEEPGIKDSLSGHRQALHTQKDDARKYWQSVINYGRVTPAKLRTGERLDAIGLVKRFSALASRSVGTFKGFPSTSSVASMDFLDKAKRVPEKLKFYKDTIAALLHDDKFIIRSDDAWPYDGDLLYDETLHEKTLVDDYGIKPNTQALKDAQGALQSLYKVIKSHPSAYYAIIALDGDSMGERVGNCQTIIEHQALSQKLITFARTVPEIAKKYNAFVIYSGGDDVLAMAPLSKAFEFTHELAEEFHKTGGTASAGIAIAHHQSPLSAALRAAKQVEHKAKRIDVDKTIMPGQPPKAAVCVTAIKRSGETLEMRSKWDAVNKLIMELVGHLSGVDPESKPCAAIKPEDDSQSKPDPALSSKLPYDVQQSAYAFAQADDPFEWELKRLLKRHHNEKCPLDVDNLAKRLCIWAKTLPEGPDELARWLLFARFVAQGGGE